MAERGAESPVERGGRPSLLRGGAAQRNVLYLAVFLVCLGQAVAAPILPELRSVFGISATEVTLTTAVWSAARLVMDLPLGVIIQRLPAGPMMLAGTIFSAAGGFLAALAPNFAIMLAGRAVSGVGAAIVSYVAILSLLELSEPNRRGRSLGIYQAVMQAGASLSPVAAGFASVWGGWPMAFAFAGFGALASALTLWITGLFARQPTAEPHERRHRTEVPVQSEAEVAAATRRVRPVLLSIDYATFALFFVTGGLVQTALPLFGAAKLGLDAGVIGLVLGIATALRFGIGLAGAELSDRIGRRVVLVAGLALMTVAVFVFPMVDSTLFFVVATWGMAIGRFGNSIPVAMLSDYAPPARMGRLVAVNRFVADLGLTVAPVAVGMLIDAAGFTLPFVITGVLVASAAVILWITAGRATAQLRAHQEREWEGADSL